MNRFKVIYHLDNAVTELTCVCLVCEGTLPFVPVEGCWIKVLAGDDFRRVRMVQFDATVPETYRRVRMGSLDATWPESGVFHVAFDEEVAWDEEDLLAIGWKIEEL